MNKTTRLVLLGGVVLLCLAGFWLWRGQQIAKSLPEDDDQTPTKTWAEVASAGASDSGEYSDPQQIGTIVAPSLPEVSGITPSHSAPGVWWVHNDSGDQARLYAINSAGQLLATFEVPGAQNVDWEDIGSGPGRDGSPALYIADIGDNNLSRDELVVYRVKEPDLSKGISSGSTQPVSAYILLLILGLIMRRRRWW